MSLDLSNTLPAETSTMEVLKPGGIEGTGWFVTFGGPAHPRTIAWTNEVARKGLRKMQQVEQAQINGKKFKIEDRDPEDVRKENVQWVVARIVNWGSNPENNPDKGENQAPDFGWGPIPFNDKNALELLVKPELGHYFSQFVEYLGNEASFTPRSATN